MFELRLRVSMSMSMSMSMNLSWNMALAVAKTVTIMKSWSGRKSLSWSCSKCNIGSRGDSRSGRRAKFVSCKGGAVSVGWSGEAG